MPRTLLLLILILTLAALIGLLAWRFPYAIASSDDKFHLFYLSILVLFIGSGIIASNRLHWKTSVKYALWWSGIALLVMIAYSLRDDFLQSRLMGELMPNQLQLQSDGSMTVYARDGGHFFIEGEVNDVRINFMVDTGATDTILSQQDAERIGLTSSASDRIRVYQTANGTVSATLMTADTLKAGTIIAYNMPIAVSQGEMGGSVLGMSFLKQLNSYRVEGNRLTLVP